MTKIDGRGMDHKILPSPICAARDQEASPPYFWSENGRFWADFLFTRSPHFQNSAFYLGNGRTFREVL